AFFDALVTKPSIRHYLKKAFTGPVDEGLAQYCYETAHQPGARYAPLYFVTGRLFTPDILDSIYARLDLPVLVTCDEDDYVSFERLPAFAERHENWRPARVPSAKSMPHFEQPHALTEHLNPFWTALDQKPN